MGGGLTDPSHATQKEALIAMTINSAVDSATNPHSARINTRLAGYRDEDYFGFQPTTRDSLPDPTPLIENLAKSVMEILAGARDLDQISRWVSDDVYRTLQIRVHASARARAVKKIPAYRPAISLGSTIVTYPVDDACEAVAIIHGRARSRAVAIRLQGLDGRWRATAIHVL